MVAAHEEPGEAVVLWQALAGCVHLFIGPVGIQVHLDAPIHALGAVGDVATHQAVATTVVYGDLGKVVQGAALVVDGPKVQVGEMGVATKNRKAATTD